MFKIENTVLLIIDVQGKLVPLMPEKEELIRNIQGMIKGTRILGIPILWSEQVPEKIGDTISEVSELLKGIQPIEKVSFSCCLNKRFIEALNQLNRNQILVTGIETHVCVYQTVVDLIKEGFEVQVIVDAVSSRTMQNKQIGLERIKAVGGGLTSLETIACELLRTSTHQQFREVLEIIK